MAKKKHKLKYRCVKCFAKWEQDTGIAVPCYNCGSLYVKWTNYEQLRKAHKNKSGPEYGY